MSCMSQQKLEELAKQLVEDANNMTLKETLTMSLMHVVQVADAVNYRALSVALCPGHKDPTGREVLHGDVLFRANTPRDAVELLWFIVDGMASTALASSALNPLAAALYDLRKHVEDTFGVANLRTMETEIINATGVHQVPDMSRGKAN